MAFSASGMSAPNVIDVYDATQLAIDTSLTTHKVALFTNSLAQDLTTETGYTSTNEIPNGSGYTTGGVAVATPTTTQSPSGTVKYDFDDSQWTSSTFSNVRGAREYADALAGNNIIVDITFGADYAVVSGTLTVQYAAGGVLTQDVTP